MPGGTNASTGAWKRTPGRTTLTSHADRSTRDSATIGQPVGGGRRGQLGAATLVITGAASTIVVCSRAVGAPPPERPARPRPRAPRPRPPGRRPSSRAAAACGCAGGRTGWPAYAAPWSAPWSSPAHSGSDRARGWHPTANAGAPCTASGEARCPCRRRQALTERATSVTPRSAVISASPLPHAGQRPQRPLPGGGEEPELARRRGHDLGGELAGGVEQAHVGPADRVPTVRRGPRR